jgi:hypothetical protein
MLSACAAFRGDGPSPEARVAAWEAGNVYPANYRAELLAYLRTYLNDPSGVREAQVSEPVLRSVGPGNRYVVCVRFNPRKVGGGYAGAREHMVVYVGGKLDRFVELRGEQQAKGEQCSGATYAAFPELESLTR